MPAAAQARQTRRGSDHEDSSYFTTQATRLRVPFQYHATVEVIHLDVLGSSSVLKR